MDIFEYWSRYTIQFNHHSLYGLGMISKDLLCCETYNMNHLAEIGELIKKSSHVPQTFQDHKWFSSLVRNSVQGRCNRITRLCYETPTPFFPEN